MSNEQIPPHLRSPEIKRRLRALLKAVEGVGWKVGGVRLTPNGEITILDKSMLPANDNIEAEWLG